MADQIIAQVYDATNPIAKCNKLMHKVNYHLKNKVFLFKTHDGSLAARMTQT